MMDRTRWMFDLYKIRQRVADEFGLTIAELESERRFPRFVNPRHLAMYLCHHLTNASLVTIGYHFRRRHYTTVLNAIRHAEKIMDEDFPVSLKVRRIAREIAAMKTIENPSTRKA